MALASQLLRDAKIRQNIASPFVQRTLFSNIVSLSHCPLTHWPPRFPPPRWIYRKSPSAPRRGQKEVRELKCSASCKRHTADHHTQEMREIADWREIGGADTIQTRRNEARRVQGDMFARNCDLEETVRSDRWTRKWGRGSRGEDSKRKPHEDRRHNRMHKNWR